METEFSRGGQERPTGFYLPLINYVLDTSLRKIRRVVVSRPINFFRELKINDLRPTKDWVSSRKDFVEPPKNPTVQQPTPDKGAGDAGKTGAAGAFKAAIALFSSEGGGLDMEGLDDNSPYKPPYRSPFDPEERKIFTYGVRSYS